MEAESKIFIAGHNGMVGSSILRALKEKGCKNLITRSRKDLDLTNQSAVRQFLNEQKPDWVIIAAAKVGGILANKTYPADFIYTNLMIECNLINSAYKEGINNLLFLGSSCIYPKYSTQPIKEEYLLSDTLEPTNEPYGIAKIAGIKLCESYNRQFNTNYRSLMPCNLYGPNDNFDPNNSHVIPAMILKFHNAKIDNQTSVEIWGSGNPTREFLHVDDLADACLFVLSIDDKKYKTQTAPMLSHINIGTGLDISISEIAEMIKEIVGFKGQIIYNTEMPDGTPKKVMDISKINQLGWKANISLKEGISDTYEWFLSNQDSLRRS